MDGKYERKHGLDITDEGRSSAIAAEQGLGLNGKTAPTTQLPCFLFIGRVFFCGQHDLFVLVQQRLYQVYQLRPIHAHDADNLHAFNGRLCSFNACGLMKPQNVTMPMMMQITLTK